MIDVSMVINLHREGRLAWRSIRSAHAAAEYARARGIEVEVIAVVDTSDFKTREVARRAEAECMLTRYLLIEAGDLGVARNQGVLESQGKYITFLDGDDLTSETWIAHAYLAAREHGLAVYHRQYVIQFGGADELLWEQPDSNDVNPEWLITESFWCSQPFAPREVFERVPYKAVQPGFCFEDWVWNCDVLASGIRHRIVPDEPIFVRRKPPWESLGQKGYADRALAPATKLFDHWATNPQRPRLPQPTELPERTREEWAKIHAIEPQCYPREIEAWHKECRNLGGAYDRLFAAWGDPDVVIACNWFKNGGADEAMLYHLRVHAEAGQRVTVLITGDERSKRLPGGVNVVDLVHSTPDLDPAVRVAVLQRLLIQKPPKILSVHNSDMVWRLLVDNPRAMTASTKVYVTAYCPDIAPVGHLVSAGFAALDAVHDHIAGCFFDGRSFRDELLRIYAYDPAKLIVVDHPCKREIRRRRDLGDGRLKVLWASRVDRQKRPELAFAIAALCAKEGLPIDFEIWGTSYHGGLEPRQFDMLTNAKYCGPFDGFYSLPLERYDVYLYTAAWDGMPNSVLAACGAGLAVVAPEVGCLPELMRELVPDDRAETFVNMLAALLKRDVLDQEQAYAADAVKNRTWGNFATQLRAVHGYVEQKTEAA